MRRCGVLGDIETARLQEDEDGTVSRASEGTGIAQTYLRSPTTSSTLSSLALQFALSSNNARLAFAI